MATPADRRPRILHAFSTFAVGGPQTRLVSLANALGPKYWHGILAMDGDFTAASSLADDVPFSLERIAVRKTGGISAANVVNARRLLRRLKPDLLLTYNWGSIEWSLANWPRLCRHIHVEDGFGPDESPAMQKRSRVAARRLLLLRAHRIVVPSSVLFHVATKTWALPPHKVLHLPNGIDQMRFARPPDPTLLATLGLEGAAPVIGTIAGLRPEKNLARMIRIFAALPEELGAKLVIVGDGPERAALTAVAEGSAAAARIVFAGPLKEPERIIGRFTVFALSSDTEQMPNAVLEAMSAGLPIVATDVGDVKRMVAAENTPYVLPPNDEAALTGALALLLRDNGLRAEIAAANQRRVGEEYAFRTMVERYDSLFSIG